MDHEESLMHVLTRLSLSVEEAMKQKRSAEQRLIQASDQVDMLSQANDALMKHVASLEARNEIVVNGLLKIVNSVDRSCRQLSNLVSSDDNPQQNTEISTIREPAEEECHEETLDEISEGINPSKENILPAVQSETNNTPENIAEQFSPEEEPQSAELHSLRIDPLVNSRINDYATEPGMLHAEDRRRSSNMRSGRLRSSRLGSALRRSSGLLRRRRTTASFRNESPRVQRGAGLKFKVDGIPHTDSSCGCFLQSIFGCRH